MPKKAAPKPVVTDDSLATPQMKQAELTQEGLNDLKAELTELTSIKLPAVIERVAKAREYGDLSENAEYHSARDEQQLVQTRIDEIQGIVATAKVIKATKSHTSVGMGSVVTLQTVSGKKMTMVVTIVGEFEAEPGDRKISSVSPLGKAIMGKKKDDICKVTAPGGEVEYQIIEIK